MFFIWYCFDDHLAAILHNPDLGHVPWWVVLLAHLFLAPFTLKLGRE
jgi:hypothetical protein